MAAILISRADGEACICFVFCKVVGARSESTGDEEMAQCGVMQRREMEMGPEEKLT